MVKGPAIRPIWGLCFAAGVSLFICAHSLQIQPADDYEVKEAAVQTAAAALSILGNRLPGPEYSLITTTLGPQDAKRLSLHPDFSAVAVDLLHQARIGRGDRIAVNMSGSFPGLNIAVLSAIKAIGADPVIISSVGASTWGATNPSDTWLDMEQSLVNFGLWQYRSKAAAIGGVGDYGGGLAKEGVMLVRDAIHRNSVPELGSVNVADGVSRRLTLYRDAKGSLPDALVNIGGSHVIFGANGHSTPLRQGLTSGYRPVPAPAGSLAASFLSTNRPVIHFINIRRLAAHKQIASNSPPGTSKVFFQRRVRPEIRLFASLTVVCSIALLWYGRRNGWWKSPHRHQSTGN